MKNITIGLLVVALAIASFIAGGTYFSKTVVQLGAQPGPEHLGDEQFLASIFVSRFADKDGSAPGITTSTVGTLTPKILCENSIIDIALVSSNNITLPSSTDMFNNPGCLTKFGQTREVWLNNASSSGSFTLVISDNASTLRTTNVTSTLNTTSSVNFRDIARLTAVRNASGTTAWLHWILEVAR